MLCFILYLQFIRHLQSVSHFKRRKQRSIIPLLHVNTVEQCVDAAVHKLNNKLHAQRRWWGADQIAVSKDTLLKSLKRQIKPKVCFYKDRDRSVGSIQTETPKESLREMFTYHHV